MGDEALAAGAGACAGLSALADWDNLLLSWRSAARGGKRAAEPVARFEFRLGESLLGLQDRLLTQTWLPGPYVHFSIHEPKRRWISAAPFADRVVHHALGRVMEPRFEPSFIGDSFANRLGKGTHRAVARLQQFARQHRHVLRLDVRQHFASIDHEILLALLWRRIREPGLRRVVAAIVASGAGIHEAEMEPVMFAGDDLLAVCRPRGLPIGNLTSQFWSNCYMHPLDVFVKRTLRCEAYLRYVDDFALLHDDPAQLRAWQEEIEAFLVRRLRLRLHAHSAQVHATAAGVPWLGFVVYPSHRRVKARKVVAGTRRLHSAYEAWCTGQSSFGEFDAGVQGWVEHVRHADTWGLRRHVLAPFVW